MKISQKEGENALLQLPIYLNFQLVSKKNDSKAKFFLRNCPSSNARWVCSFTNSSLEEKLGPVCDLAILVRGLGRIIKQDENKNIVAKLTGQWSKQSMSTEKLKTIRH